MRESTRPVLNSAHIGETCRTCIQVCVCARIDHIVSIYNYMTIYVYIYVYIYIRITICVCVKHADHVVLPCSCQVNRSNAWLVLKLLCFSDSSLE